MPTITLRFKEVKIRDYPLAIGQSCSIGRKHSNDIVIDHPTVSGSHAVIESVSTTFILRDLGSTNGTFIDKDKISLHQLRHNDVVAIGNHKLVFDFSDMVKAKSGMRDDYEIDKTRIFDPSALRDVPQKPAGNSAPAPSRPGETSAVADSSASFFSRLLKKIFG